MIENQPNELTLIFHSEKEEDKKARAFIETVTKFKVKTLDLKREALTETQIAEIAAKMEVPVKDLIDLTYKDRLPSGTEESLDAMVDGDILLILKQEPILINTPIVIIGKIAYRYKSAYDLLNSNMTTEGVVANASGTVEERRD